MARRPLSTTPDRRYNGENHSPTVDGDFQQHYQAAERAYGAGKYDEAHRIATMLLDQLGATPEEPEERAAVLGWRAFVALLLGHIELYGLDNPSQASRFYQTVLDSQPHDTLGELAQQGLTRASAMAEATPEPVASPSTPEPEATAPLNTGTTTPEILRDPFLPDQPVSGQGQTPSQAQAVAMPWLDQMAESSPEPAAQPSPTPEPEPEPEATIQLKPEEETKSSPEPAPEPTQDAQPAPTEPVPPAQLKPEAKPRPEPEPEPEPSPTPAPAPQPDPMDLLAGSLLRVTVQLPETPQKNGGSPMGSPGSTWLRRLLRRR